jgi:hypothetical protein
MKKYTNKYTHCHVGLDPIVNYGMYDYWTKRGARKAGQDVLRLLRRSNRDNCISTAEVVQVLPDGSTRDLGQWTHDRASRPPRRP